MIIMLLVVLLVPCFTKLFLHFRTLSVQSELDQSSVIQWLRHKSQTELWALVQKGNPQEIIPYSTALSIQLNQVVSASFLCSRSQFPLTSDTQPQVESGTSLREFTSRREIRENVTQALTSLVISSLQDVHQISSALSQSTVRHFYSFLLSCS